MRRAKEDPAALTRMAQKYDQADGVAQDFAEANRLYCRAARLGDAEAQFRLGWIYTNGRGVTRDTGIAAVLFAMAAEQGHEYARRRLQYVRERPSTELPSCLRPVRVALDTKARREIETLVKQLAPQYAIDPQLVMAVISVESNFNTKAVSPKNAQGLMQLIPETAERFGVQSIFDPAENIKGGLAYLRWLMAFFKGDVKLVLAAYNAGERAVEQHQGVPPYDETRNYVTRITSMYRKLTHPYNPNVAEPSAMMLPVRRNAVSPIGFQR
jgi:soluble lytic murein transglycosylase-like protein